MTYVHSGSRLSIMFLYLRSIYIYIYICQARWNMFHLLFVEFAEGKYLILTFEKAAWASHKEWSRVHTMVHFPCIATYTYCWWKTSRTCWEVVHPIFLQGFTHASRWWLQTSRASLPIKSYTCIVFAMLINPFHHVLNRHFPAFHCEVWRSLGWWEGQLLYYNWL